MDEPRGRLQPNPWEAPGVEGRDQRQQRQQPARVKRCKECESLRGNDRYCLERVVRELDFK